MLAGRDEIARPSRPHILALHVPSMLFQTQRQMRFVMSLCGSSRPCEWRVSKHRPAIVISRRSRELPRTHGYTRPVLVHIPSYVHAAGEYRPASSVHCIIETLHIQRVGMCRFALQGQHASHVEGMIENVLRSFHNQLDRYDFMPSRT
jgi:hypothetical protein